jgi:clan AA aspartic protease
MGLFTVPVTLTNPDDPRTSMRVELLVDTGSTYMLLPPDVVAALGLPIREERPAELASGERVVHGVGEVRVGLGNREFFSVFVAGPTGCPALLGAVTLEAFGLAVDPVNERLFPVVAHL